MNTKSTATFFHAGCPVCLDAERQFVNALDPARYRVEVVHLGTQPSRLAEARSLGVQSVPALAMDGTVYHINFGAALSALEPQAPSS
jgi:hypothetical protein